MGENARESKRRGDNERASGHWIVKIWLTGGKIRVDDGCVVLVIDPWTRLVAHAEAFLARNDEELSQGVVEAVRKAEETKKIAVVVDDLRVTPGQGGSR